MKAFAIASCALREGVEEGFVKVESSVMIFLFSSGSLPIDTILTIDANSTLGPGWLYVSE